MSPRSDRQGPIKQGLIIKKEIKKEIMNEIMNEIKKEIKKDDIIIRESV